MSFMTPSGFVRIPTKSEIDQPFAIDVTGAVGKTSDPLEWAESHIVALLMTSPGERVMRPTYGTGLRQFVFENGDPLAIEQVRASIKSALSQLEPIITVHAVTAQQSNSPTTVGEIDFGITYSLTGSSTPHTTTITTAGNVVDI